MKTLRWLPLIFLSFGFQYQPEARVCSFHFENGFWIDARLLSVRDTAFVVGLKTGELRPDYKEPRSDGLMLIHFNDIDTVIYQEPVNLSGIGTAMAIGSAAGSGCGYIIGTDDLTEAGSIDLKSTLTGLGVGLGVGLVYGLIANAGRNQLVITAGHFNGQRLKALSLYPYGEPDFLKVVW